MSVQFSFPYLTWFKPWPWEVGFNIKSHAVLQELI